ncbi:PAS domain S-box-containing protein [Cyclobacterium xiamenense]|uniref:histidine kinase n=1 Tax=Cyclobacterium xiamenense TaxID=1297121 RepID=A0A1H6TEZ5_9BACT|nr:PAS domain-containing protein [Cyclobacterium xiamenense]SEI75677.1 PAS domain S-box-containing protein [Cyclobacterium xiamenense]
MESVGTYWSPLFDSLKVGVVLTDSRCVMIEANADIRRYMAPNWRGKELKSIFLDGDFIGSKLADSEGPNRSFSARLPGRSSGMIGVSVCPVVCSDNEHILWTLSLEERPEHPKSFGVEVLPKIGCWKIDLHAHVLTLDQAVSSIWGIGQRTQLTLKEGLMLLSGCPLRTSLLRHFYRCMREGRSFDKTVSLVDSSGTHRWVRIIAHALDEGDRVSKMYGSLQGLDRTPENSQVFGFFQEHLPGFLIRLFTNAEGKEEAVFFGDKVAQFTGVQPERVYKQEVLWNSISETDRAYLKARISHPTANLTSFFYPVCIQVPEATFWFQTWWTFGQDEGLPVWEAIFLDISSQKQAETALSRSDEKFKKLVSSMDDLIFTLDKSLRYTGIYGRSLEYAGISEKCFLGKTAEELLGKEAAEVHGKNYAIALCGNHVHYEWSMAEGDARKWFLTKLSPMIDQNGEVFGLVGIVTDATDRKQMLEEVLIANQRHELVNKATNEVIYDFDLLEGTIFWGGSFDRSLGHKKPEGSEFSLRDWESWVHPEDLETASNALSRFLLNSSGKHWSWQYRIKNHRGNYFYVLERGFLLRDKTGKALRMIGSLRDINREMVLKNKLKSSYQRLSEFRTALDQSTNIILTDLEGIILDVNQSTCDLSGYSRKELLGVHTRINRSDHHPRAFYQDMWKTIQSGKVWKGEIKNKRKDGTEYWVLTSIFPLRDRDNQVHRYLAVRTDITKQKQAQEHIMEALEKVMRSEKKYSDLFHNSPIPMWVFSTESLSILDVNQAAIDNYGYTKSEFLQRTILDLRPPHEAAEFKVRIKSIPDNRGIFKEKFVHQKKSGERIKVEVSSIPIDLGSRKGKLVVANDITQTLNYLEKVEKQNAVLRDIAWTQSHLVRAPLARLLGLVDLLREEVLDENETQEFLSHVCTSAGELDDVIRSIAEKTNQLEEE